MISTDTSTAAQSFVLTPLALFFLSMITVACGDKSEEPQTPPAEASDAEPAAAPKEGEEVEAGGAAETARETPTKGPFTLHVEHQGLFDASLHKVKLPKRFEEKLPGPRWIAHGKLRNDSEHMIHQGDLFGALILCFEGVTSPEATSADPKRPPGAGQTLGFDEQGCLRQEAFNRGFELPLSGMDPWRPGQWRHFTVMAGPVNPVYREMTPSAVRVELQLRARSALGASWDLNLWEVEPQWDELSGYAVMRESKLSGAARFGYQTLERGQPVFVEGVAGRSVLVRHDGRRDWVSLLEFPSAASLIAQRASPTPLPHRVEGQSLIVEVRSFSVAHRHREASGESDERFLIVDLAVTGLDERQVRLARTDFDMAMGHHAVIQPLADHDLTPDPMAFEAVTLNERQTGSIAFPWPYGAAPLFLNVNMPDDQRLTIIPPRVIE